MFSHLFLNESFSSAFTFLLLFVDQSFANCTYFERPDPILSTALSYHCNSTEFSGILIHMKLQEQADI